METDNFKTPSQLANEAEQTGRDAVAAAQGLAEESKLMGRDAANSIRNSAEDAKRTGQAAVDAAKGYAAEAIETAKSVAVTGRAYAQDAVNAAGRKIGDLKIQADQLKEKGAQYVGEQPVRSVVIAAAGGAVLTALFLAALRGGRR